MKQAYLWLLAFLLGARLSGSAQTMANTDNVITLTNTCMQGGLTAGTYTLDLFYYDIINNTEDSVKGLTVTVAVSGGVMTITGPSNSFPSSSTIGYDLADAWPGHLKLNKGSSSTLMFYDIGSNGSITFNCFALPNIFGSVSLHPAGTGKVDVGWITEEEENSTFLEVWRSRTDSAHSFYKIGQVTAAGNSSLPIFYSIRDTNMDTRNYYFIKLLSPGLGSTYSDTVSWRCDDCVYTPPARVNCVDSIIGPDHICGVGATTFYRLSSAVPNYSTILWTVDDPTAARVTYLDDPASVSLRRTNVPAVITLKAIMSGCTDTISKTIVLGSPKPALQRIASYCPFYDSIILKPLTGATGYTWRTINDHTLAQTVTTSVDGAFRLPVFYNTSDSWDISVKATNTCGTSDSLVLPGIGCEIDTQSAPGRTRNGLAASLTPAVSTGVVALKVTPNPTIGRIGVSLDDGAARHKIYQVRVLDMQGIVRKILQYPGVENVSIDLADLNQGIYTVQVFDNRTWLSGKVMLTK